MHMYERNGRRGSLSKRLCAIVLTVALLAGLALPAMAADENDRVYLNIEQVPNDTVKVDPSDNSVPGLGDGRHETADPNEIVRVSIVLENKSTLEAGFPTKNIAANVNAINYRTKLRGEQATVQSLIERNVLKGQKLDVVWNLTLAANIISANVRRGDIEAIASVPGVRLVEEETVYYPQEVTVGDEVTPNMAISGAMTGAENVWGDYTGAGRIIAIIDTGLDLSHQSFNAGAFEHAIEEVEQENDKEIDLLDKTDVESILAKNELNAERLSSVSANNLYRNSKVPFAFSYGDQDLEVTHMSDMQGNHGSHVAGIAAANRYIATSVLGGETTYEDAMDKVGVSGVAPDAQLLVMKVFGAQGSATDSDCVAAIEDAIILGADSVNLSLGISRPGTVKPSATYQRIQETLLKSDTVVVYSIGNSGTWSEYTTPGELYSDGVSNQMGGESGSYTNSFTVASVDNDGMVGPIFKIGEKDYSYYESLENTTTGEQYHFPSITTLDTSKDKTGSDYDFVIFSKDVAGQEETLFKQEKEAIQNKIVILWRGTTNFSVKVQAAYENGAKAVIVSNNEKGGSIFGMDLSAYTGNIPAVTIRTDDGQAIWEAATQVEGKTNYRTGKIKIIDSGVVATSWHSEHYTMSDYSSWGTTGDLALKPEITAPGGSIYSVQGATPDDNSHSKYISMSGTSMASPQVSGMVALIQEYLHDKDNGNTLPDHEDMTFRALAQALLMSTSVPMKDVNDNYYSLMWQGSGLANVAAAVTTPVFITIDDGKDVEDGKVKAELGDDFERNGEYTVTFTLHNMKDEEHTYKLSGEAFTQAVVSREATEDMDAYDALDTATSPLKAAFEFEDGDSVEVPAHGTVTVTATIKLDEQEMKELDEKKNDTGAYVEAFIFATPESTTEGETLPELSFPVLAYYGSWTDPSMFDLGTGRDWYTDSHERLPYLYDDLSGEYTNILYADYAPIFDGEGIGTDTIINGYDFSLIRNIGGGVVRVSYEDEDGEKVVRYLTDLAADYGAYFWVDGGYWSNDLDYVSVDWIPEGIPDGTKVEISLIVAPEYYAKYGLTDEGTYDWEKLTDGDPENGELGKGAYLTTTLTVDSAAPEILTDKDNAPYTQTENGVRHIHAKVKDNVALSSVALYSGDGETLVYRYSTFDYDVDNDLRVKLNFEGTEPNEVYDADFDGVYELMPPEYAQAFFGVSNIWVERTGALEDDVYLIQATDAAGNTATYRLFVGVSETNTATSVVISETSIELMRGTTTQLTAKALPTTLGDRGVTWSSSDDEIATVDQNGVVTGVGRGTTTIVATSKANGETGDKVTAECEVTVWTLPIVADGVVGDENGQARFFTWDFAESDTPEFGDVIRFESSGSGEGQAAFSPSAVADIDGSSFYMFDGGTDQMYRVGREDGIVFGGPWQWDMAPWSMAYTNAGLHWTYGYYLMVADDAEYPTYMGFDFSGYGNVYFYSIAALEEKWTLPYNGTTYSGDLILYATDQYNEVWQFFVYQVRGEYYCLPAIAVSDVPELPLGGVGDTGYAPLCSLIVGSDDALYYSMMTGRAGQEHSSIYRLVYDEENDMWNSTLLGSFGNDVWPALFLGITEDRLFNDFNGDGKVDEADAQALLDNVIKGEELADCKRDADVDRDGNVDTHDVSALLSMLKNGEIVTEMSGRVPEELGVMAAEKTEPVETPANVPSEAEAPMQSAPVAPEVPEDTEGLPERAVLPTGPSMVTPNTVTGKESITASASSHTVSVPVSADKTTNGDFTLTYDPDVLTLKSFKTGDVFTSVYETEGSVRVGFASADQVSNVQVFTAEFGFTGSTSERTTNIKLAVYEDGLRSGRIETTDCTVTLPADSSGSFTPGGNPGGIPGGSYTPVTPPPTPPHASFTDIPEGAWYAEAVDRVYDAGLMNGVLPDVFAPTGVLDRGMMAVIAYRLAGKPEVEGENVYTDVPEDAYYADAVRWATANGIISGDGKGSYRPNDSITREEFAVILWRCAKHLGYDVDTSNLMLYGFKDADSISSWGEDAMLWVVYTGIMNGRTENMLMPKESANRAEIAMMLVRFMDLVQNKD